MVDRYERQPYLVPEVKQLWIDALESGEYTQGVGALATKDGGNCCLGVLCELAVKAGVLSEEDVKAPDYFSYTASKTYKDSVNYPPHEVAEWAFNTNGVPGNASIYNPRVAIPGSSSITLSELNDDGATFAEIANYIKEQL